MRRPRRDIHGRRTRRLHSSNLKSAMNCLFEDSPGAINVVSMIAAVSVTAAHGSLSRSRSWCRRRRAVAWPTLLCRVPRITVQNEPELIEQFVTRFIFRQQLVGIIAPLADGIRQCLDSRSNISQIGE